MAGYLAGSDLLNPFMISRPSLQFRWFRDSLFITVPILTSDHHIPKHLYLHLSYIMNRHILSFTKTAMLFIGLLASVRSQIYILGFSSGTLGEYDLNGVPINTSLITGLSL